MKFYHGLESVKHPHSTIADFVILFSGGGFPCQLKGVSRFLERGPPATTPPATQRADVQQQVSETELCFGPFVRVVVSGSYLQSLVIGAHRFLKKIYLFLTFLTFPQSEKRVSEIILCFAALIRGFRQW